MTPTAPAAPSTTLVAARDAQAAYRDHFKGCRTPYQFCVWCQWHEKHTAALFYQADAERQRLEGRG
jgi:hypothetical protein